MFYIGQKVVCINDDFSNLKDPLVAEMKFPKKDRVYTIREVSSLGLLFEEIINDKYWFIKHGGLLSEPKFAENRFIPIVSEFKKIEFEKVIEEVELSSN